MIRIDLFSVVFVTLYVFVYVILIQFEGTLLAGIVMMMFSPFLLFGMVYSILKYGRYNGRELGQDEFGYHDKSKEQLEVF